MLPFAVGATTVTIEQFRAADLLKAAVEFGVTRFAADPATYEAMLAEPALDQALATIKTCIGLGAPISPAFAEGWRRRTGREIVALP